MKKQVSIQQQAFTPQGWSMDTMGHCLDRMLWGEDGEASVPLGR